MPVQFLNDEQRRKYARFGSDPSPDQLARYFHLDVVDRALILNLRGDHNRLGFALMLCSARFLGAFPDAQAEIPAPVLTSLTKQLGPEGPSERNRTVRNGNTRQILAISVGKC